MIKKAILFVAAFALVCTFALGYGVNKAAADNGPAEMVLKTGDAKKPATFPHKAHQDKYECAQCHHGAADGKQTPYVEGMAIQKCTSCHNDDMANAKLNSFKNVAHERCKGCHKEAGGNAPTKCSGCHVKS
jgi:hypothetical protein